MKNLSHDDSISSSFANLKDKMEEYQSENVKEEISSN